MEEHSLKQKRIEKSSNQTVRQLYQGPIFTVERHSLLLPGNQKNYDIVKHLHAVAIVPINPEGKILLIKQWRRATEEILVEIPAGLIEKNELPLDTAQRELQE